MESLSREIAYPTVDMICEVNRRMIDSFGGYCVSPDNLQNRGSLEYILAVVVFPVYGVDMYPSLKEKAAALVQQIVSRHIFWDGNKRTGANIKSCGN